MYRLRRGRRCSAAVYNLTISTQRDSGVGCVRGMQTKLTAWDSQVSDGANVLVCFPPGAAPQLESVGLASDARQARQTITHARRSAMLHTVGGRLKAGVCQRDFCQPSPGQPAFYSLFVNGNTIYVVLPTRFRAHRYCWPYRRQPALRLRP